MADADAIEAINKRLDWIEEALSAWWGFSTRRWGGRTNARMRPVPPEIQELVAQGNAKEAVKRYRELTGLHQQAQAAIESSDQSPGTCRATKPLG